MAIDALPTPPSRSDPANFAERGDAFMSALPGFAEQAEAARLEVVAAKNTASAKAVEASASAASALDSKNAAVASAASALASKNSASASATAAQEKATEASASAASIARDEPGGVAGLTLFKLNMKNVLGTITSFFTNANTASRTYTLQDRSGTLADDTDLAEKADLSTLPEAIAQRVLEILAPGSGVVFTYNDVEHNFVPLVISVDVKSKINVFTKNQSVQPVALVSGASVNCDAGLSNNFHLLLSHNGILENPSNLTNGMVLNWVIEQDVVGGRTLGYGSVFDFGAAGVPVLSTAVGAVDLVSGYYHGPTNKILCSFRKGA